MMLLLLLLRVAAAAPLRSVSARSALSNDARLSRALAVEDVAQPQPPPVTAAGAAGGRLRGPDA